MQGYIHAKSGPVSMQRIRCRGIKPQGGSAKDRSWQQSQTVKTQICEVHYWVGIIRVAVLSYMFKRWLDPCPESPQPFDDRKNRPPFTQ